MPVITLQTFIHAPAERCFRLSLSVDLHLISTSETNERAIAGVTTGVMKLNDTVTWRARHFGLEQDLTSKITAYSEPEYFVSEMVKGAFKKLHHQHIFKMEKNGTMMTDIFEFEAPFGWAGKFFSELILKPYMKGFLVKRNEVIKAMAEGDGWKKLLK